jgi:hypothetical protein
VQFVIEQNIAPVDVRQRVKVVYGDAYVNISTSRRSAAPVHDANLGHASLNDKQHGDRRATDVAHRYRVDEISRRCVAFLSRQ